MKPRILQPRPATPAFWSKILLAVIALGLTSRLYPLGWIVWDKYLGDALYAVMVYVLITLWSWPERKPWKPVTRAMIRTWGPAARAAIAMMLLTLLELFQLTMIPAAMAASAYLPVRLAARLLGTEFSFLDLGAYLAGLFAVACWDSFRISSRR